MSEIGYRKPPEHSRFKVGNLEHLKRKKKGQLCDSNVVAGFLLTKIEYREGGKLKKDTRIALLIKSLGRKALAGDVGAADQLLKMREHTAGLGHIGPFTLVLSPTDMRL